VIEKSADDEEMRHKREERDWKRGPRDWILVEMNNNFRLFQKHEKMRMDGWMDLLVGWMDSRSLISHSFSRSQ